jgi:glycogen debranching enzyme
MPRRHPPNAALSARQHRRKEQILTQPEPSKVRETTRAVVLKQGSLFLLANDAGDVPWRLPHGLGLFYEDCRFLDGYVLALNGSEPTVLSSAAARGYETYHELANPELPDPGGGPPIPKNTIALRRTRLVRGGVLHELISIRNYGRTAARLRLDLRFRTKFEDMFVLKGFVKGPRGTVLPPRVVGQDMVELGYAGHDGFSRTTAVVFSTPPEHLQPDLATFTWTVEPGSRREVAISITPSEHRPIGPARRAARPSTDTEALQRWLECSEAIWLAHSAEIRTSNPLFDRVLRRALLDLRLLRSRLDGLHYFAAGIPWFATLFGRDAATVAVQTLPYGPAIASDTLRLLARYQATKVDVYRDAEPGKILHEFRTGELAQTGSIPQSPAYYGTVDATPLFLILLAEYVNWSGDLELARALRPNVEAALGWMEHHADHDGDGYLDYVGCYANGVINQGWKDAGNAIVNADGSLAEPPIAPCEVQAYAYRAWRQTAALLRALGERERAATLEDHADDLRARFERDFWSDELSYYVLARQAGGRPAAVVSSNAGQVLWGGIAGAERAARIAERLLAPDMFSGWGIRTLSSNSAAYNPMSYHTGSVWPHDNGLIVAGLRRYGHDAAALRVFDGLFDAAASFPEYRLPELYCGYHRREGEEQPIRYPVACSPQAWAAGAIPHALWNLLGLRANALEGCLRIVHPRLPGWLDWLELRGVPVGRDRVDLRFTRNGHADADISVDAHSSGTVRVESTDRLHPPDAFH